MIAYINTDQNGNWIVTLDDLSQPSPQQIRFDIEADARRFLARALPQ